MDIVGYVHNVTPQLTYGMISSAFIFLSSPLKYTINIQRYV